MVWKTFEVESNGQNALMGFSLTSKELGKEEGDLCHKNIFPHPFQISRVRHNYCITIT